MKRSGKDEMQKPEEQENQWESLDELDAYNDFEANDEAESKDYETEDYETEDYESDDLELEEDIQLTPKKIAIFCGLFLLAVLICIPLWSLTHKKYGQENVNGTGEAGKVEASSEGTEAVGTDSAPGTGQSANKQDLSDPVQPADTQAPTDTTQPTDAQASTGTTQPTDAQAPTGTTQPADAQAPADTTQPTNTQTPVETAAPLSTSEDFLEVSDKVTAKDVTNLRSAPTTEDEGNVVAQLRNGESLTRTGFNDDTGWSRLDYNGQTVYAVTRYLTVDLDYKTPEEPTNPNRVSTQDGRVIIFVDCDDNITPKEYVNLRTEPSTSQGDATVRCQVKNGESVHRTGYSQDSGWSRVDYNGEILYVVTNYMVSAVAE